jgi:AcrR family transcriptional regulator
VTTTPPNHAEDGPSLARRERILEAARAAIEEHGPGALTGQIARRAEIPRPHVYRVFASKDDLDLALARSAYHEVRAAIRARLDSSGTPLDIIRALIEAQVTWADEHQNLYRFLVIRGYQGSSQPHMVQRDDFAAELAALGSWYFPGFAEDPEAGEETLVALIGLIDASVLRWLSRRVGTREQLINRLTTQAWLILDHHLREFGSQVDPTVPFTAGPGESLADPETARGAKLNRNRHAK